MKIAKKGAAFFLSAALLFGTFTISANAAGQTGEQSGAVTDEAVTGDLDGDGQVTLLDVITLQKHLAKVHMLTTEQIVAANFSSDGTVTVQDVTKMQKKIAAMDMAPAEEDKGVKVTAIKLDKIAASVYVGDKLSVKATVVPADADNPAVTFTSSNEKIAAVNSSGQVTALAAGKAIITVSSADGQQKAECELTVMEKSTLSFSGFKTMSGNKIVVDQIHTLTGTVKSNYPITSVCVRIKDTKMAKTVKIDKSKNVKSYDINPAFDDLMAFSLAGIGKHTFEVIATDSVTLNAKTVFTYNYTVTAAASSSSLKQYSYKNKTYFVPKGYSGSYLYDQRDYGKFMQGGTNVGCSATAEAIGASILYNKKITPNSSQIIWTGAGAGWGLATSRYYNCSVDSKLSRAYSELQKGKPSLVNTLGSSDHWVVIIGVSASAKKGNLSTSDFLIANPWGGTVETLSSYLSSTGRYIPSSYSMRCY